METISLKYREIVQETIEELLALGADHVQVKLDESDDFEVYGSAGELDLVRSVDNAVLEITVLKDQKRASTTLNHMATQRRKEAMEAVMAAAENAEPDSAYSFSAVENRQQFTLGHPPQSTEELERHRSQLTQRMAEFVEQIKANYPEIMLSEMGVQSKVMRTLFKTSRGTHLEEHKHCNELVALFNAVDGEKSSSFNYAFGYPLTLESPFLENPFWQTTLSLNARELNPVVFEGRHEGDVILSPACFAELLMSIEELALKDSSFIKGFSKWQGRLGEKVCDEKLTWHSETMGDAIGPGYGITRDGYVAERVRVLERGVLKSYLLSDYAATKTGQLRSGNQGGLIWVDSGEKSFEEMLSGIANGIYIGRLSGGQPSPNGDFSGVAKNSFTIKDGKISEAITEAMTTFNAFELLADIVALSQERHNTGMYCVPYLWSRKISVTGK